MWILGILVRAFILISLSGFTPLTEQLSKRGAEGAEIIRNVLVGYFTKLLEVINTNGGDTIKVSTIFN